MSRPTVVVFDFFGTLARATASVGLDEILARHGHTLPDHLQEMWWSGDIDGTEHIEQSRSRDHYLAWQRERLVAMLHEADVHPGEHDAILADLQAGRAERVLEAYDEVPRRARRPGGARRRPRHLLQLGLGPRTGHRRSGARGPVRRGGVVGVGGRTQAAPADLPLPDRTG